MRPLKSILLCFTFLSITAQIFAQTNSTELGNVTVTASLYTQQQKETGRNIMVIKGEYFNLLPVNSIDDLLRYTPGIEVQQRGPQGSQSDIIIRGGTFQQVLVIIDGVKLNDPLTGHFNSYIPVHPAEIDRIEILKGAASAIYGSEAVGAVINIITRTFTAKNINTKNSFNAGISAGEYNLVNTNAGFRLSGKRNSFSGGFMSNHSTGQPLRGTRGFFHLTTAGVAFTQQLKNKWRVSGRIAGDMRDFNAQNYYTTFGSDTANEKVNSVWGQFNINKQTQQGSLNADIAFKKLRDQFWFRPAAIPNDNKTNLLTGQAYYSSKINANNSYTTGLQFHRKEIRSNDRGNHQLWHGAAYFIMRHRLSNELFINESIRADWDESYGLVLVPQLNIAWSPSNITLRASAGRSVRDADFTERFNNYNKALVTSGSIGNPGLEAESSWNIETGMDYQFSGDLKLSSTIFFRDHRNLIDWAPTAYADMPRKTNLSPTGSYALASNTEKVKTTGVELDIFFNKTLNKSSSMFITAGYTYIHSKNEDSIPSFYISSHARHLLNLNIIYNIKTVSFAINGLYKEREEKNAAAINAKITPDYFIMNFKIKYTLTSKKGAAYLQVDNVTNRSYSDLLGSQMPGRWLSGGIEITL